MSPFADARGSSPRQMTDRDRAYVLALYKLFGAGEFEMHMIRGRRLPSEIGQRFGVESDNLADKTVLRVRLPELGLIAFDGEHRIKLTEAGLALARGVDSSTSERSLVGSYHRFGEIGPVYEVLGQEDEGFVMIRLVESGDTAKYPAEEVRNDPTA